MIVNTMASTTTQTTILMNCSRLRNTLHLTFGSRFYGRVPYRRLAPDHIDRERLSIR